MRIRLMQADEAPTWDNYVLGHPFSTHCHLSGWKSVIEMTYGHRGHYLIAEEASSIVGILPLIQMKSMLFGSRLVSMPFLNCGGILAESKDAENALIEACLELSPRLGASIIELRHSQPLQGHNENRRLLLPPSMQKVRMVLELPGSPDKLMCSMKSKLRSQIRRPMKEGMISVVGGQELLDDFYRVFSVNMRDLGSPVHSRKLFTAIFNCFKESARIGLVQYKDRPVAAGLVFCFLDTVEIPWASSLREYGRLSPNMLLYWSLMEFACQGGYRYFDFGRTSQDKGTYRFKEQWGARPSTLYWYGFNTSKNPMLVSVSDSTWMLRAADIWQNIPVSLANLLGPVIRKSISL